MDKATEYLLLQEAKFEQLRSSMKVILPNLKGVFLKPNKGRIKTILNRLPNKDVKTIERDAVRQIPGFKKDYLVAQRKVSKLKLHPNMNKPAAVATALVSSTTSKSVDDVLNKGQAALRNAKLTSLIPGSSLFPLIQFGLLVIAMCYILVGLDLAIPVLKLVAKALVFLLSMVGSILGAMMGFGSKPGAGAAGNFFPGLSNTPLGDIPLDKFIQSTDKLTNFVPDA